MNQNDAVNVNESIAKLNSAIAKLNVSGRGSKYPMMAAPATQQEFAEFVLQAVTDSRELPSVYTAAAEQSKAWTDCVWIRTGRGSNDYVRFPKSVMQWLTFVRATNSGKQEYYTLLPLNVEQAEQSEQ